jgi:hypothetical protein
VKRERTGRLPFGFAIIEAGSVAKVNIHSLNPSTFSQHSFEAVASRPQLAIAGALRPAGELRDPLRLLLLPTCPDRSIRRTLDVRR